MKLRNTLILRVDEITYLWIKYMANKYKTSKSEIIRNLILEKIKQKKD